MLSLTGSLIDSMEGLQHPFIYEVALHSSSKTISRGKQESILAIDPFDRVALGQWQFSKREGRTGYSFP
jgi:hypothetical protein